MGGRRRTGTKEWRKRKMEGLEGDEREGRVSREMEVGGRRYKGWMEEERKRKGTDEGREREMEGGRGKK